MHKFFFIIGFLIVLSSCRSSRQVVQKTSFDSTSVTFQEVEKTIHIPGDSIKTVLKVQLDHSASGSGEDSRFISQEQTIETGKSKLHLQISSKGEITAESVVKDHDEKVTVLEKTISSKKSETTVFEQKEPWFKRTLKGVSKTIKTVVITILILLGLYAYIRFRGGLKSFVNKFIFKKS